MNINPIHVPDDDDGACEAVIEYRAKLRAWNAQNVQPAARGLNVTKPSKQSTHSVRHAFGLLVAARMQLNGGNRQRAIRTVARQEPGLYQQYLDSLPRGGPQLKPKK